MTRDQEKLPHETPKHPAYLIDVLRICLQLKKSVTRATFKIKITCKAKFHALPSHYPWTSHIDLLQPKADDLPPIFDYLNRHKIERPSLLLTLFPHRFAEMLVVTTFVD